MLFFYILLKLYDKIKVIVTTVFLNTERMMDMKKKKRVVLKKQTMVWSTKQVSGMLKAGTIYFDKFVQRPEVWSLEKKSALIESILLGCPIGIISMTAHDGVETKGRSDKKYSAWDGQQRTTTIMRYRDNEFELKGIEGELELESGDTYDLNGKKYEDLPVELRDTLDASTIVLYIYKDLTLEQEIEMYNRINSGHPVSRIELIRTKSPSNKVFTEMTSHPLFDYMSEASKKASITYELIMKTCALMFCDTTDLSGSGLSSAMRDFSITDEQRKQVEAVFTIIHDVCDSLNTKETKKARVNLLKKSHLLSFIPVVQKALANGISDEQLAKFVVSFFGSNGETSVSKEYNACLLDGSASKNKVEARIKAMSNCFDSAVKAEK